MDELEESSKILADSQESLSKRFRALFTLRNYICKDSVESIGKVLVEDESDLLKHECAYCLGQMKDQRSIPYLLKALKNENQHTMVRHEAGEALGAIGIDSDEILELLKLYAKDEARELAETCTIALDRLKYYSRSQSHDCEFPLYLEESLSPYDTVDPSPSYPPTTPIDKLKAIYLDEKKPLFERYKALFAFRNMNTPDAIAAICEGFSVSPTDSALFKHEVAFVLGQMQSPLSVDALEKRLADLEENDMVRHECAEALGSIGRDDIIKKYLEDKSRIVRESCQVALDMANYYNDEEQFDFL